MNTEKAQNIFLEIEYIGKAYFGFQIQEKKSSFVKTIQASLEESLCKLFKQKIRVTYAGRTDRGVHAKGQVVNFNIATRIPLASIRTALNTFLPPDIFIKKIKRVPLEFHARFWASSKIYRYIIFQGRTFSVFQHDFTWQMYAPLDLAKMKQAAQRFIGYRDFSVFAKEAKKYKHCKRNLTGITIKKSGQCMYIDLEADGFLRNMARNIVSFLVKIGNSKIALKDVDAVLKGKLPYINKPAPACGLYLWKVKYES